MTNTKVLPDLTAEERAAKWTDSVERASAVLYALSDILAVCTDNAEEEGVLSPVRSYLKRLLGYYANFFEGDDPPPSGIYADTLHSWLNNVQCAVENDATRHISWYFNQAGQYLSFQINAPREAPFKLPVALTLSLEILERKVPPPPRKTYGPLCIQVSGPPRSGKTRAQLVVAKALHEAGYTVRCSDSLAQKRDPEEILGHLWHSDLGETEHCGVVVSTSLTERDTE